MNERDRLDVLAELVEQFDNDPNGWDDVLRRAHAPSKLAVRRELDAVLGQSG